jgi:LuxR family maltose regulon positive regulatory protein
VKNTLLQTKLQIPPLRQSLVHRPHIFARLDTGLEGKLTLVSAPAGSGKTTLLSAWVRKNERQTGWLSLDEADNDLARFWSYVAAALQGALEDREIGAALVTLFQSPHQSPVETLISGLINQLSAATNAIILILDDYHAINVEAVHQSLTFLLDHMPSQLHLIIASRAEPPLPLARLRVRGHLTEITASDLRFTPEETAVFLNDVMGVAVSAEEVEALESRTEGWIAGLQVAALSLQGRTDTAEFIRQFSGGHRHVLDYLGAEVLEQQPREIHDFLLQTSILHRLSAPLCTCITGQQNSQGILEQLETANLFLLPLDDERRWYRYHRLFADFLRNRLRQSQADQIPQLHGRASQWYEQEGFINEAIDHAISAGDHKGAIRLMEQLALPWMSAGLAKVQSWLEALPGNMLRSRPRLFLAHLWAQLAAGQVETVEADWREAESIIDMQVDNLTEEEKQALLGELACLRANLACYQGDMQQALILSRRALELMPEDDLVLRNLIASNISFSMDSFRQPDDAISQASRLLARATRLGDVQAALMAINSVGIQTWLKGRLHQVAGAFRATLDLAAQQSEAKRQSLPTILCIAHSGLSLTQYEWNELAEARSHSENAIALAADSGDKNLLMDAHLILARILAAQDEMDEALANQQKAEQLAQATNTKWIMIQATGYKTRLWLARGELQPAVRWAEDSDLQIGGDLDLQRVHSYASLGRVWLAAGNTSETLALSDWLLSELEKSGIVGSRIEMLALKALALAAQGNLNLALGIQEQALTLAEPGGYVRLFIDEGEPMANLLRQAARQGIAPHYVDRLLAAFDEGSLPTFKMAHSLPDPLSERELQVLRLLAAGLTNQEIAGELYVSLNTVKWHVKNIYIKLDTHNRAQTIALAQELGLLKT